MGQELDCRMQYQGRTLAGKAYFESDHILFRGEERLKIAIKDLQSVAAEAGMLHLDFPGGPASLELGAAAEKWAHKILHPPSRADKLGIKPGLTVRLAGEFDREFHLELRDVQMVDGESQSGPDLFRRAGARGARPNSETRRRRSSPPARCGWSTPRACQLIREIEVIAAGRAAGLKDTKVASFSSTHTALRFVIPVAQR